MELDHANMRETQIFRGSPWSLLEHTCRWEELEGYLGEQAAAVQHVRRLSWDITCLKRDMGERVGLAVDCGNKPELWHTSATPAAPHQLFSFALPVVAHTLDVCNWLSTQ